MATLCGALGCACRVGQYSEGQRPRDAAELANRLLTCVYMGTEVGICPYGMSNVCCAYGDGV